MAELADPRDRPVAVGARVKSKVRFARRHAGVGNVKQVGFGRCADVVVVTPEAVGDGVLGSGIHGGFRLDSNMIVGWYRIIEFQDYDLRRFVFPPW